MTAATNYIGRKNLFFTVQKLHDIYFNSFYGFLMCVGISSFCENALKPVVEQARPMDFLYSVLPWVMHNIYFLETEINQKDFFHRE
jgi:hypothetical protein